MFDELAERSLMSPLAGTKHTYVRLAIIVYCQILALFSSYTVTHFYHFVDREELPIHHLTPRSFKLRSRGVVTEVQNSRVRITSTRKFVRLFL